jgi:hypothetical protein
VVLLFALRKSAIELFALQLPTPFVHDLKMKTKDCRWIFGEIQTILSELLGLHPRAFHFGSRFRMASANMG